MPISIPLKGHFFPQNSSSPATCFLPQPATSLLPPPLPLPRLLHLLQPNPLLPHPPLPLPLPPLLPLLLPLRPRPLNLPLQNLPQLHRALLRRVQRPPQLAHQAADKPARLDGVRRVVLAGGDEGLVLEGDVRVAERAVVEGGGAVGGADESGALGGFGDVEGELGGHGGGGWWRGLL